MYSDGPPPKKKGLKFLVEWGIILLFYRDRKVLCVFVGYMQLLLLLFFFLPERCNQHRRIQIQKGTEQPADITPELFQNLKWRNIGPANMMGRVSDIEGVPGNPNLLYVGSASGGIWKTINGGTTWAPIFDDQPVSSIGDLALEPGNSDVIYVGTGEANVRNSVSFGNGVYKSTDGGNSWTHLGWGYG